MLLKKILLVGSFITIIIIGALYGVSPSWFVETFLKDTAVPSVDQSHIFRAVMTLYFGLGLFWLYAAFSDKYRDAGLLILAIFCGALVSGRIISVIMDGAPSPLLVLYIFMEAALVPASIWLLKKG